jgi:uncharacterized protein (DUF2141 family)
MRKPSSYALACMAILMAAGVQPAHAAANANCKGPALDIEVEGLKDRTGMLVAELYPANEADFLDDAEDLVKRGKTFRRVAIPTSSVGAPRLCVIAPAAGTYALIVIHNRDGKDKFSISKDGVALPAARSIGRSRPKVQQAMIFVGKSPGSVAVRMQYLSGLRGFLLSNR